MSEYEPLDGKKIVREQLALEMRDRFVGRYDPTLVFLDGEWHYPITAAETLCGIDIPETVTAVNNGGFSGPSTKACSVCSPPVGGMTKRSLRQQIVKFLDDGGTNTNGFTKNALVEILAAMEEQARSEWSPEDGG